MIPSSLHGKDGAALVAVVLIAVIVLAALLNVNATALVTVAKTSRALEVARQNVALGTRLESVVREAAQGLYGVSVEATSGSLVQNIRDVLATSGLGSVHVSNITVSGSLARPDDFPNYGAPFAPLSSASTELSLLCSPVLVALWNARGSATVAESTSALVSFEFSRAPVGDPTMGVFDVECRLVSVPMTRHGIAAYELPVDIGSAVGAVDWPSSPAATEFGPLGLVAGRDPAHVPALHKPTQVGTRVNLPGYYRALAAQADAYQYVFSDLYVQRAVDSAGPTHFYHIGGGSANPALDGFSETNGVCSIDVGRVGRGTLGPATEVRNVCVVHASAGGQQVVLSDTAGGSEPLLLLLVGPGGGSPAGQIAVEISGDITRPCVFVVYNGVLNAPAPTRVNGALFLDPATATAASTARISVGHLSFHAGGQVDVQQFGTHAMAAAAEVIAPRVVYAATGRRMR